MSTTPLAELLGERTVPGELYTKLERDRVHCYACGHNCIINPGKDGICKVRSNRSGTLYVPHGYVGALQVDPIEKKPFFHVLPGSKALSFGMLGCDYRCAYCQNWLTSQTLKDPEAVIGPSDINGNDLVAQALGENAPIMVSTYNEPLITSEWAVSIFSEAKKKGLVTGFVSNGNATPKVLEYLRPHIDMYKVDLKGFDASRYRRLGGEMNNVLQTIEILADMGIWTEVVTLVVPGFNDSREELSGIARFLAGVNVELPWHVTAFHPDYRMTDKEGTGAKSLLQAANIGKEAGLRYVYAGNLPEHVTNFESTFCPSCDKKLIHRVGFRVLEDLISSTGGLCPGCDTRIPGLWIK